MKKITNRRQHLIFKLASILILISIGVFNTAYAKEFSKNYSGNIAIKVTDLIDISVINNDAIINTTNEQNASFKLKLVLDLQNNDEVLANEILESLNYEIIKENGTVQMNFPWPIQHYQANNFLFFSPKAKFTILGGKKFEIKGNINVKMTLEINIPKKNLIKLKGNHSTIKLGHLNNNADINAKFSKLYTNDIESLKLDASFSDINIGNIKQNSSLMLRQSHFNGLSIGKVDANLNFSTIEISECTTAVFHSLSQSSFKSKKVDDIEVSSSRFSDFDIQLAKSMIVQYWEHGKISIERIDHFDLKNGLFINIFLDEVAESIAINTKNSNMILENLHNEISDVDIKNEFASVTIGTEKVENFDLILNNASFTTVEKSENIIKNSDNHYTKRTNSGNIKNIDVTCPNCTIIIK